ncbi:cysteine--tRNA ligase [Liquorilactobacillus capillatus]|uniref:Cysteine--tRNA ligase n=1 Tax=Liquorilactobacillus capillatus DSM 19910 TaxID=1423731 RepID=A0A0R1M4W8_9LACO|nr:cysteine--tRNA ligase [Liquorilactobacillus capillatus]KRL02857.1 cysteinyl-tRNA synthetase [Liquorilactobacillus capillatus DSM 19910]
MIRLYNTLTNKKEIFKPLTPKVLNMYVCGPTVYNYIHIGNARSAIAFDTVRRYFEFRGFKVNYVSNFTDVDDKIIRAGHELNLTTKEVADKFIKAFYEDIDALNIERATQNPRVVEMMGDIIAFVKVLIEKDYAYVVDGDVYYRARKFKDYGQLSGQSVDELEQGASTRISSTEFQKKEDPLDFALWKKVKPGEISWDSPWGKGRPGWHIECSVMATKILGDTIDIHAGGQDLEFPHHENEIAQSEAKTGQKFANYWMHNGFVTVGEQDEKMSKSLGNFVTVHELLKKVDPQVIRFFMATTQYRRPIRYSQVNIAEAQTNLAKIQTAFENASYRLADAVNTESTATINEKIANYHEAFIRAMDDDFNAQNGIAVVYELVKEINIYSSQTKVVKASLKALKVELEKLMGVFGIKLQEPAMHDDEDDEIEKLVRARDEARAKRDFARSDEIRDQLKQQGITLEDTPQGTRWKR